MEAGFFLLTLLGGEWIKGEQKPVWGLGDLGACWSEAPVVKMSRTLIFDSLCQGITDICLSIATQERKHRA